MTDAQWFMLVGGLLLVMGLTTSMLKRAPLTSAIIYLAVGVMVGPTALNLFHFNPLKQSALLEVLTEVAVLISLFSAGVKMPVPFKFCRWRAPVMLATVSMIITVVMVAEFAFYVLDMPLGAGILLGAILAPTDPGAGNRCANPPPRRQRPIAHDPHLRGGHERRQCFSVRDAGHGHAWACMSSVTMACTG